MNKATVKTTVKRERAGEYMMQIQSKYTRHYFIQKYQGKWDLYYATNRFGNPKVWRLNHESTHRTLRDAKAEAIQDALRVDQTHRSAHFTLDDQPIRHSRVWYTYQIGGKWHTLCGEYWCVSATGSQALIQRSNGGMAYVSWKNLFASKPAAQREIDKRNS